MLIPPNHDCRRTTLRGRGDDGGALRRAADVLAYARHPGVAEFLDVRSEGMVTELDLALPEGWPLCAFALSVEELAGVAATIATTVADLHDIGVAVGAITAQDIVVTSEGHAVLTDFTRAERLPDHHAKWSEHPAVRRDDRDVGRLLCQLLDACAPSTATQALEANGRRRTRRPPRRSTPSATAWRSAERAARGAIDTRKLAERLATDIPGACLPRRPAMSEAERPPAPAVASDEALHRWLGGPPASVPTPRRPLRARWAMLVACAPGVIAAMALLRLATTSPSGGCIPADGGCATYRAGLLSVHGARYSVGTARDVAAIGRWWCGASALALLRPSTGQVWLYRTWPSAATPAVPVLGARAAGARALALQPGGTCDRLVVVESDGRRITVSVPGAP